MNFDELKDIWKQASAQDEKNFLSKEELAKRIEIKSKTQGLLSKLNRSLAIELGIGVVFFALVAYMYYHFVLDKSLQIILISTALIVLPLLAVYYIKFRNINKIEISEYSLKEALQSIIGGVGSYVRFYYVVNLIFGVLLIPASLLFGQGVGSFILFPDTTAEIRFPELSQNDFILMGIIIPVLIAFYYFFLRMYIKKLYGNHLDKLKSCHKELSEEPNKID